MRSGAPSLAGPIRGQLRHDGLQRLPDAAPSVQRAQQPRHERADGRARGAAAGDQHVAPDELAVGQHRLAIDAHPLRRPGDRRQQGRRWTAPRQRPVPRAAPRRPLRLQRVHVAGEARRSVAALQHDPLVALRGLARHGPHEGLARRARVVAGDLARFPEVRLDGAVARVEQARQLAKVPVLLEIELGVDGRRRRAHLGAAQRRRHVGRRQHRRRQRQVHARREQRVDEAGGVADEHVRLARQPLGDVRPVARDVRPVDARAPGEHRRRARGQPQLRLVETLRAQIGDALLPPRAIDDGAHAAAPVGQGDRPAPAIARGLDEDVARVGRGQVGGAVVVGVDGQIAEGVVVAAQRLRPGDQPRLPAGIDDEARPLLPGVGGFTGDADAGRALPVEQHLADVAALPHLDAGRARVVEQQLIEARAPDLVGVRMRAVRLAEVPRPRGRVPAPDHRRAGLLDEALALDRLQHPQRVEDRQRRGQQRFAHVRPREALALAAQHAPALARQQRGGRGAARPAPNDDHVPGVAGHGGAGNSGVGALGARRRRPQRRAAASAGPSRTGPAGPTPCRSRAPRG